MSKKPLSMLIAGLLASSQLHALGLGDPQLNSWLGEPLHVTVPLHLSADELLRLPQLEARIGDRATHQRMQLDYRERLQQLTISVVSEGDRHQLHLQTRDGINEPLLEFPLDVRIGSTRVVRTITLLLDPPAQVVAAPAPTAPVTAPRRAPTSTTAPVSTPPAPAPRPASPARIEPRLDGDRYGPVATDQTLGDIASTVRPAGASLHQTLVALWQHNPEAFLNDNMNRLMAGSTLVVPSAAEILALDPDAARREVVAQYQAPRSPGRRTTASATTPSPAPRPGVAPTASPAPVETPTPVAQDRAEQPAPAPATPDEPRLSLLAPSSLEQIPEVFRDEVQILGNRLQTLNEENSELRQRLSDMEQYMATLSRQVIQLTENTLALSSTETARMEAILERLDESLAIPPTDIPQTDIRSEAERVAAEAPPPARPATPEPQRSSPVRVDADTRGLSQERSMDQGKLIRYGLIGGVLLIGVAAAGLWYRRIRQRDIYRNTIYRL